MPNDEVPFRSASRVAGYAYNTLRKMKYLGSLPFPVYERRMPGSSRAKLFCRISEIEAWKVKSTIKVA